MQSPQPFPKSATAHPVPYRILYAHNNADLYGSSRSLMRLLKTLDRSRFHPLVVLPETGLLKDALEAQGVEVVVHPGLSVISRPVFHSWRLILFFFKFPLSVLFLWRMIRRRHVDLVHTNNGVVLSPALAAWLARVPHVWHARDWFQEFRSFWPVYAAYMQRFSNKIIAISHAVASQFPSRKNVVVIHNGFSLAEFQVPVDRLRDEFRKQHGLGDTLVVGCVGRIKMVRKGQEILVQATALLKQRGVFIKALIVGAPAPIPGNEIHLIRLKEMAVELQIQDRVVFAGELTDTRPAYAAMDIFTLTSVQPEPLGGVISEAMCMGLPVIATNVGGPPDLVVEGVTGFLVPPGDPKALADAIEKLARDPALRQSMGRAGVERIRTDFSLPDMAAKFQRLYEEAIAARH
jgi:glycosyltransferase involved in cell wall biosynthesis